MLTVEPYRAALQPIWDAQVRAARNGVFLFERGYMDYHADRFVDGSLMVFDGAEVVAALPAHRIGDDWVSHGGLTFGGLLMHPDTGAQSVLTIFDVLVHALRERGARRLVYKPVPHIFHRQPSEDDLYALHRLGARTVRVDLSTTIDLARRPSLAKGRRHALSKARRAGVVVRESDDYPAFWTLLEGVLADRHGSAPTHRLDEITLLAQRFPQICLFGAYADAADGGELLAGAVGALDAVIAYLLDDSADGCRWLSFGVSTVDQGRTLNTGLVGQKEMFGGRSTVLQTLELDLQTDIGVR